MPAISSGSVYLAPGYLPEDLSLSARPPKGLAVSGATSRNVDFSARPSAFPTTQLNQPLSSGLTRSK